MLRENRILVFLLLFLPQAAPPFDEHGDTRYAFYPKIRSVFVLVAVTCLLIVGSAQVGAGQASSATLTGTVEDQTGAVLPNVAITVTNTERNTSDFTRTNEI